MWWLEGERREAKRTQLLAHYRARLGEQTGGEALPKFFRLGQN